MENDEVKVLWDFNVESDHVIVHRRPDIVVLEKKEKNALLIDIAIPGNVRVAEKEEEKLMKYQCLVRGEIGDISSSGGIRYQPQEGLNLEKGEIEVSLSGLHKVLGMARTLWDVFGEYVRFIVRGVRDRHCA